ncbi:MAG: hypothetical protein AAGM38_11605 [Pseudomonadota bacterium]
MLRRRHLRIESVWPDIRIGMMEPAAWVHIEPLNGDQADFAAKRVAIAYAEEIAILLLGVLDRFRFGGGHAARLRHFGANGAINFMKVGVRQSAIRRPDDQGRRGVRSDFGLIDAEGAEMITGAPDGEVNACMQPPPRGPVRRVERDLDRGANWVVAVIPFDDDPSLALRLLDAPNGLSRHRAEIARLSAARRADYVLRDRDGETLRMGPGGQDGGSDARSLRKLIEEVLLVSHRGLLA